MASSNMYKRMSLLGVVESHSSWILLAISLVVGPLLRALPLECLLECSLFLLNPTYVVLERSSDDFLAPLLDGL